MQQSITQTQRSTSRLQEAQFQVLSGMVGRGPDSLPVTTNANGETFLPYCACRGTSRSLPEALDGEVGLLGAAATCNARKELPPWGPCTFLLCLRFVVRPFWKIPSDPYKIARVTVFCLGVPFGNSTIQEHTRRADRSWAAFPRGGQQVVQSDVPREKLNRVRATVAPPWLPKDENIEASDLTEIRVKLSVRVGSLGELDTGWCCLLLFWFWECPIVTIRPSPFAVATRPQASPTPHCSLARSLVRFGR